MDNGDTVAMSIVESISGVVGNVPALGTLPVTGATNVAHDTSLVGC